MKRLLGGALTLVAFAGCADDQRTSSAAPADTCACAGAEPVVDPALLAFLSKAKTLHHQADLALEAAEVEEAVEALDQLVEGPVPGGEDPPPEAREVLADTLARTAELRSRLGALVEARQDVSRGLELAVERNLFRGRLLEVRGVVEQRQHERLLEEGDEQGASAAKARAISAFEAAVDIQDEVIQRALGDDLPAPAAPAPEASAP